MGTVPLSLIAGPANAGKVELLLDRYLAALEREPVLIVPNRSDVDRVERELLARRPALLGGSIGTFDDVFERIARRRAAAAARRRRSARCSCAASSRARRSTASPRRRASAASPTRCCRRSASSSRGCSTRSSSTATSPTLHAAYRAELDRLGALGSRPAAPPRGRAAPVRPRRVARRAGLRVRLRGPDRRRVGAARGARRRAPRSACRFRTSRAVPRSRRSAAPPTISRVSPAGASRSCRRAGPSVAQPALAHLERALFADEPPPPVADRRRDPLLRGRRRARRARARRRGAARAAARAERRRSGSGSSARASSAGARRSRPRSARSAFRTRSTASVRLAQTPFGQALAALLRFAWLGGTRGDLFTLPALAVLRARAARGRLRRRPPARTRDPDAGARRRGGREAARRAAARRSRSSATPTIRSRRCATLAARMLRNAYGLDGPPVGESSRLDLRAYETLHAPARRARRAGARSPASCRARTSSRRSSGRRCARCAATSRAASPSSTCSARARAASTSSSCSGWRREACRGAARRRRSSTTTRGARSTSAARGCSGPTPVSRDRYLFYTACTRPLAAALPRPRGGDRRRQPARAEPVLGRGAGGLRRRTTCGAGRAGARSRR